MTTLPKLLLGAAVLALLLAAVARLVPPERRAAVVSALPELQGRVVESEAADAGEDGYDEEVPRRLERIGGAPAVRLTAEEQRYSGIRTATLHRITYRREIQAYGEVVDILPLLRLRAQHSEAQAEQEIAQARLQVSAQAYERLRGLNVNGNVISASRMRGAQSRWQVDKARLAAAEQRVKNVRAQAVQAWGRELTAEAMDQDAGRIERLVNRKEVLLRITLAPDQSLSRAVRSAYVERNGERPSARAARFVSAAARTSLASQGETYFFRTAADGLRTGMRVVAWIPRDEAPSTGLLLPASAAVWYAGEPWVYVQVDEELFARRAVPENHEVAGGWLARARFSTDEAIVVSGGQMLLSEEFRWQIPEEDDD